MKNRISISGKLRAFTILEISVTLILSFFLLGILYLSYNIMSQYLDQKKESDLSLLLSLRSEFEMIFCQASGIEEKEEGLCFFCKNKESLYIFPDNAIIRKQASRSDTLYTGKYSYRISEDGQSGRISRLILKFEEKKDTIQLIFDKQYLPNQLLKDKEINFEY